MQENDEKDGILVPKRGMRYLLRNASIWRWFVACMENHWRRRAFEVELLRQGALLAPGDSFAIVFGSPIRRVRTCSSSSTFLILLSPPTSFRGWQFSTRAH